MSATIDFQDLPRVAQQAVLEARAMRHRAQRKALLADFEQAKCTCSTVAVSVRYYSNPRVEITCQHAEE